MRLLIKLGGTLLEQASSRDRIASELSSVAAKHEVVIVHGGGKQVTSHLEKQGVKSRFVSGLRVSDESVITAVIEVIAGGVNKRLVAALVSKGLSAVGLSGVDGFLTEATQLNPELGLVGKPGQTNARLLNLLVADHYVPVVACIAGSRTGEIFNVNADQMAVSCAIGWQADQLIFLTDVAGVKGADGAVASRLTTEDSQALIRTGVAHGGMQAKLEAAQTALEGGIKEVMIAPGQKLNVCRDVLAGEPVGTRIVPQSLEVRA